MLCMLYCFYKWLQFLKNHGLSVGFAAIIVDVMIIMGCVNGKTVPEPPHHSSVIYVDKLGERHQAPAQEQTANGHHKQHHNGNGTTQNDHRNGTTQTQKSRNSTKPSQRVPKWKARFDPRVTAKYDIKALIGKGSFSFVVRVENKLTKEPFAIKMIDRIQGKELFDSELNVLRRVRHMYIIQLTEVFESKEKIYMVMQLATGGELFDRIIAKGSFTERDATNVLSMMLDGLQYLHGLGITHRDLKPENLLYYHPGHDSKILITDFGLSACRKAGENYMMHTTCGTPEYIGPEILARKPYTSKVDMWAVGVITYILLSGTMPFDDENKARLYRMILKVRYNFDGEHWKDVSALAKDFIDRLLRLDPADRPSAQEARKHPWLTTSAASSSNKNLHRTISKNLLNRQSTRNSVKSAKSTKSNKSDRSSRSLRSEHRRVLPEEIEALHKDPEVQAELTSLSGR